MSALAEHSEIQKTAVLWFEVRLVDASFLDRIYFVADQHGAESIHHFNSEPWHPTGPVVRVLIADQRPLLDWLERTGAGTLVEWDASSDEKLFGDNWPLVYRFFEAASRLHHVDDDWTYRKIVHCALNSWGFAVRGERDFGRRFVKERRRMLRHDFIYSTIKRGKRCRYGCHL